jgi:UDP:flavonoid glycosyltransferase YjiC (YdhE family)
MVPLAWAFRSAGHEVRIAAQPKLTPATVGAGLTAVEVGGEYDVLTEMLKARAETGFKPGDLAALSPEALRKMRETMFSPLVKLATLMAPDLLRFARGWQPQLIVTDPLIFATSLVSGTLGIPLVRHIWGVDVTAGHPLQGGPTPDDIRDQWPTGLVELFDQYGVAVRNDYPLRTVDPWPGSLQPPAAVASRMAERFVPYNGSGSTAIPDWILDDPGRPRVCVTWGTTTALLDSKTAVPAVVDALAGLDVEIVLAVGPAERDELGDLPGNARVAVNVPLNLLMPGCDITVNQGGPGTVLTAASYAVPQVLIPKTADTPVIAACFNASGACVVVDEVDAKAISSAVTTALTDESMRAAARKVRDEITGAPALSDVVGTLGNLA